MTNCTLTKRSFSWGDVKVLKKSIHYTCVIHPEHLKAINEGKSFKDEQGCRWETQIKDGVVTLTNDGDTFTLPLEQLNA